mgnify:CR=1 FL=1
MEVLFNNFASGTLLSSILGSDTLIQLDVGEGQFFPTPIVGAEYSVLVWNKRSSPHGRACR